MNESTTYVPGICNINRAEIAYRRKAGSAGLAIAVVLAVGLFAWGISRWVRLVLIVPLFITAIGYLQARNRFCVSYAASGRQNASDGYRHARDITSADARAKDKAKARKMNLQAAAASLVATVILIVI